VESYRVSSKAAQKKPLARGFLAFPQFGLKVLAQNLGNLWRRLAVHDFKNSRLEGVLVMLASPSNST
jgi:hypothetical protein